MQKTDVPGVYQRGGVFVYTYRKRGRQRWGTAPTKAKARAAKAAAETDVARGEHRDTSPVAFGDYARAWIESYQGRTSRGFRESTRRSYQVMLERRLIPFFERDRGLRLAEIEARDVKAMIAWLSALPNPDRPGQLLARSTVNGHLACLRAMLADAREEGLVRFNAASGVRLAVREGPGTGREAVSETRALTVERLAGLLSEIPEPWRLFFEFLTHTGLRIGEASELRWGRDIRFGTSPSVTVSLQFTNGVVCAPKTQYGHRTIPLSAGLARRLWVEQGPPGSLVFTTRGGRRLNRHNLYRDVLGPAAKRAGVQWVTFHTFRHTCASLLFAAPEHGGGGKNVKQVQEWLGHHSPAFTLKTYVHLLDDGVGGASFFDALVGTRSADNVRPEAQDATNSPAGANAPANRLSRDETNVPSHGTA